MGGYPCAGCTDPTECEDIGDVTFTVSGVVNRPNQWSDIYNGPTPSDWDCFEHETEFLGDLIDLDDYVPAQCAADWNHSYLLDGRVTGTCAQGISSCSSRSISYMGNLGCGLGVDAYYGTSQHTVNLNSVMYVINYSLSPATGEYHFFAELAMGWFVYGGPESSSQFWYQSFPSLPSSPITFTSAHYNPEECPNITRGALISPGFCDHSNAQIVASW